ncbi:MULTISPECIES: SDR family NAD(P)-dependent oxidoreductase [unclassified Nostoc]|uniref:SDR family NAD(P)-dependent oxidoreductase n=1 Tax=unclassified Nostoc TaxID=2593658 RepID=UPI0025AAC727|nr:MULTISPECIES: SDR family NAD(P)-dependent oxidoreductase [unclassified Nostoc]MDM9586227.1 SDR family NAD(P)-dependent oxidoreductase [Nostoc sp. GT001]MDZ7947605.1 SDR family NAD(P)-dependent oxidoreductase [Nostoc sp. EfeVER01]MDZ7990849.1 SDR family NAD(P)-dependent oxidoreductase [Nostoc sp. EspVER01]
MDLKLHGKSALVSGSTAGIGLAIALGLAQEGASVIVNGRSEERVAQAIAKIKHSTPDAKVSGIVADAGTASGVEKLIQEVPHVDILINNVGIYEPKTFFDITDKDWLNIFEVNVLSGVRLSRQYLQKQLEQNWGRIIFISSESGIQIPVEMIHYGTTKTAQLAIARGLAEMTVGTGVTVNSVLPGPTRSEGVEDFITNLAQERGITRADVEAEFFENVRPSSLIKRFATNEEVAAIVVYLSSPVASATNGAALRVDGGVIRSIV